jgi:hypothetical protein
MSWTADGQAAVFVAIDHHSAECVGLHAARRGAGFEVLEPLHEYFCVLREEHRSRLRSPP